MKTLNNCLVRVTVDTQYDFEGGDKNPLVIDRFFDYK